MVFQAGLGDYGVIVGRHCGVLESCFLPLFLDEQLAVSNSFKPGTIG